MLFGRVADAHWMLLKLTLDACLDASRMRSGCVPDALDAFGCFRMLSHALDAFAHFPILDYYVGCFFGFLCFLLLFVFVCFVIFRLNVFLSRTERRGRIFFPLLALFFGFLAVFRLFVVGCWKLLRKDFKVMSGFTTYGSFCVPRLVP